MYVYDCSHAGKLNGDDSYRLKHVQDNLRVRRNEEATVKCNDTIERWTSRVGYTLAASMMPSCFRGDMANNRLATGELNMITAEAAVAPMPNPKHANVSFNRRRTVAGKWRESMGALTGSEVIADSIVVAQGVTIFTVFE